MKIILFSGPGRTGTESDRSDQSDHWPNLSEPSDPSDQCSLCQVLTLLWGQYIVEASGKDPRHHLRHFHAHAQRVYRYCTVHNTGAHQVSGHDLPACCRTGDTPTCLTAPSVERPTGQSPSSPVPCVPNMYLLSLTLCCVTNAQL